MENGLDIANANTMIIEDAHRIGLAQSISSKAVSAGICQAYAYIIILHTKIVVRRLSETVKNHTGFYIFRQWL